MACLPIVSDIKGQAPAPQVNPGHGLKPVIGSVRQTQQKVGDAVVVTRRWPPSDARHPTGKLELSVANLYVVHVQANDVFTCPDAVSSLDLGDRTGVLKNWIFVFERRIRVAKCRASRIR